MAEGQAEIERFAICLPLDAEAGCSGDAEAVPQLSIGLVPVAAEEASGAVGGGERPEVGADWETSAKGVEAGNFAEAWNLDFESSGRPRLALSGGAWGTRAHKSEPEI